MYNVAGNKNISTVKMFMKHIFQQTCQLIVLLHLTRTYVLFAANLDDFRSIAKKFIPEKLADNLTNMAAQNSMKYRQQLDKNKKVYDYKESDEYSDEATETAEVTKPAAVRETITTPMKRFAIKYQEKDIDFDALVDRVREQLEDKFKTQLKEETQEKRDYNHHNDDDRYEDKSVTNTELMKEKHKINKIKKNSKTKVTTKHTTKDPQVYYDDNVSEKRPSVAGNEEIMFKEADLTQTKDSYEDYITPDKKIIFESDSETKTTKLERTPSEIKSGYKEQRLKPVATVKLNPAVTLDDDQDSAEDKFEEVKAKIETLTDEQNGSIPKKLKGTMIPTREYYKMSSPNYYAKIPAIAEKYDFNEPLPEQDREPENLKHFVNPPALINNQFKLTST